MRHPNSIEKVNFIVDFVMDPCDAPWQVYLRALAPATLKAFMTYYALDMVQIFTGYVRPNQMPKGKRTMSHRRGAPKRGKPRTWLRWWRRISGFDPWEATGKALPGADDFNMRRTSIGVMHLWSVYGVLQRFAWWFMVISIVEDFFYDWASGVAESSYCRQQNRAWAVGFSQRQGGSSILELWPCVFQETLKERNGATISGNGGSLNARGGTAFFQAKRIPYEYPELEAVSAVPVLEYNGVRVRAEQTDPNDPTFWQAAVNVSDLTYVNAYFEIQDGFAAFEECQLTIIGWVKHGRDDL